MNQTAYLGEWRAGELRAEAQRGRVARQAAQRQHKDKRPALNLRALLRRWRPA